MTLETTIAELNVFCTHSNEGIAEFAQKAVDYARALQNGEIDQQEYHDLMGDIEDLRNMADTADEQNQVVKIFECVRLIPNLI